MAPIYAGDIGITPQIIDDEQLVTLRNAFATTIPFYQSILVDNPPTYTSPEQVPEPLDIGKLVALVEPWQTWKFEEQVSKSSVVCARRRGSFARSIPSHSCLLSLITATHTTPLSLQTYRWICRNGSQH